MEIRRCYRTWSSLNLFFWFLHVSVITRSLNDTFINICNEISEWFDTIKRFGSNNSFLYIFEYSIYKMR